ncbi:hypothetical protein PENSTE_c005G02940 [Penicillium steckii]|uniref:Restriction endonuclease domain-containing protein n=1 Tax=Penicillium steckii TaxID=303698 RepID=A0A1V6TJM7_9EURO|nr:hypothetical protein PENSTE_c005G02940 [Penicillium steckii]
MAPSLIHGFTVGRLEKEIIRWITGMDLLDNIETWPGSGIPALDNPTNIRTPDASYGPSQPAVGFSDDRPSFVIEVGYIQTLPSLDSHARWWVDPNKGNAALCLVCKLDRTPRLVIDIWEGGAHIAPATRPQYHIVMAQKRNTGEITVRGNPLAIRFPLFMRRLPRPESLVERDLILDIEDLKKIARDIWIKQGLIRSGG